MNNGDMTTQAVAAAPPQPQSQAQQPPQQPPPQQQQTITQTTPQIFQTLLNAYAKYIPQYQNDFKQLITAVQADSHFKTKLSNDQKQQMLNLLGTECCRFHQQRQQQMLQIQQQQSFQQPQV